MTKEGSNSARVRWGIATRDKRVPVTTRFEMTKSGGGGWGDVSPNEGGSFSNFSVERKKKQIDGMEWRGREGRMSSEQRANWWSIRLRIS